MIDRPDNDWQAVFIALLTGIVAALHYGKVAPALPQILTELPLGLVVGGWVVSVFSATGAAVGIALGSIADSVGARRLAVTGLIAVTIGSLLGSAAPGATVLLISRFCEGLGFIAVAVSAPVLTVRAVSSGGRALALGIWTTYMPLGMGLAMLVGPGLLLWISWRELWLAVSVASALCALLVYLRIPADPAGTRHGGGLRHHLRLVLRSPGSWLLSLAFMFYTLQWISLMAWLPSFLLGERGLSAGATGVITAVVVLCNVPGNMSVGWLLGRGLRRWSILALGGIGMGASAVLVLSPQLDDGVRLAAILGFSYFGGLIPGVALSGVPAVAPGPAQIGTVNGMLVQGAHFGQMLGPPALAAVVAINGDWGDIRWLLLLASLAICAIALAYRRRVSAPASL